MLIKKISRITKRWFIQQTREIEKNKISYSELKERMKKNEKLVLVDVRSPQEYQEYHLNNAINIPLYELENRVENELDKEQEIILYCQSGIRSKKAADILKQKRYSKVFSLDKGLDRKK